MTKDNGEGQTKIFKQWFVAILGEFDVQNIKTFLIDWITQKKIIRINFLELF